MEREFIIAGLGGQGIQVAATLLGHAAVNANKRALLFAMFGGSQRGGDSECLVAISDEDRILAPPVIMQPISAAICMAASPYSRFEKLIRPGGLLAYNVSVTSTHEAGWIGGASGAKKKEGGIEHHRDDIAYLPIPASTIAQEKLGAVLVASLITLGAFATATKIIDVQTIKDSLKDALRPGRHKLIPLNKKALDLGAALLDDKSTIVNREAMKLF